MNAFFIRMRNKNALYKELVSQSQRKKYNSC